MQLSIFVTITLMAFLGSWHCGVMCGPLSCNFRKRESFFSYHIGRLISYSLIAAALFYGTHYFLDTDSRWLKMVASLFFGILLVIFGLLQLQIFSYQKRVGFRFFKVQMKILEKFRPLANRFPVVLGLLTGLFPCGWLYSFLVISSQMKSISHALLVILIFWLTSLPAFLVFTGFMSQLIKTAPTSYQKISATVLILAGVFSICGHWLEVMV